MSDRGSTRAQGLPDHAHVPTLRQLPKELPVVASPAAARIAANLGFKRVYELDHGQEMTLADGRLRIRATAGAARSLLRRGHWRLFSSTSHSISPAIHIARYSSRYSLPSIHNNCVPECHAARLSVHAPEHAGALVGPPWSKRECAPPCFAAPSGVGLLP